MTRRSRSQKNQCHYCETDIVHIDFITRCSNKRCQIVFCEDCIVNQFDQEFQQSNYNPQFWICYKCQGKCACIKCEESLRQPVRKTRSKESNSVESSKLCQLDITAPCFKQKKQKQLNKEQEKLSAQQNKQEEIDQDLNTKQKQQENYSSTSEEEGVIEINMCSTEQQSLLNNEESTNDSLENKQKILEELLQESIQQNNTSNVQDEIKNNSNSDLQNQEQDQQILKRKADENNVSIKKCDNKYMRRKLLLRKLQSQ